jgi:hypothetical protein
MARDIDEIDDVLGEAPSPDREVMRFKTYIDFGLIALYTGLFLAIAVLLLREEGWGRAAGAAAIVCAIATSVFNSLENVAILRVLDVPLHSTAVSMINSIRSASAATWALGGFTLALLSYFFLRMNGWLARTVGGLLILSATVIGLGFNNNHLIDYGRYSLMVAHAGIAALFIRVR